MAFPYGSSMSNAELAKKFGWPSMIISILLLPITFLWSKLLAFPVWLNYEHATKPKCMVYNTFRYDNPSYADTNQNLFKNEFYFSPKTVGRWPGGWNCHVDRVGGKFFESFFGLINCLDIDFQSDDYWVIKPNFWSWLIVSEVQIFFHPDGKGHSILFYFPLDGPNKYNPFFWATMTYIVMGIKLWSGYSFKPFMEGPLKKQLLEEDAMNRRLSMDLEYVMEGKEDTDEEKSAILDEDAKVRKDDQKYNRVVFKQMSGRVDMDQFQIDNDRANLDLMISSSGTATESTRLITYNHAVLKQSFDRPKPLTAMDRQVTV